MSNKKRLGLGLIVILVITFGVFLILPRLIFSDDEELRKSITVTAKKPPELEKYITKHEPPKQEIRQAFENEGGWDLPLDSCGGYGFLYQIRFDPLPEVNKPTKIYVKLKSCGNWDIRSEEAQQPPYIQDPRFIVHAGEEIMDFTELEPKWYRPIKKGDIYEGSITIVPREIGRHGICIAGQGIGQICFYYGFDEDGKLVHLSDRGGFPKSDLPFHPLITDKEIYVKFNGQYVTNLFHITPPLSLNDTSTVYYRVITKDYYPDGMKIVTRDGKISFEMLPGPITKGDTLEGSFKVVPPRLGANSFALDIEEPPREGVKPKNDRFLARYHLDKDGKLLYIVKTQKESKIFYEYFKKKGVTVGEY